ncbi:MAG: Fic family protein [Phycisphaerales bacterium]|nr:Fic family protein [Phycisphaerales bacterium]
MARHIPVLTLRTDVFSNVIPLSTVWLLTECMEYRGKQGLWIHHKPETLTALRERAMIQSAESSNRIEGITVAPERLRPLVLGKAIPKDRPEEEVAGYRRALNWIFTRKLPVHIDPRTILHLHSMAQEGMSGDAGRFKSKDNEIIELRPGVGRIVRFRPVSAAQSPDAVRRLCETYNQMVESRTIPPLLLAATFVFDFLCIHPFRDGNGRVSRLLTTLLLQQQDMIVSRFVSLERLVEENREEYYRVLGECSRHWAEGRNQIAPWWNYFLTILRRAYVEFAETVERASSHGAKTDLARQAIHRQVGPFTLADIKAQVPSASLQLLKKVLAELKSRGRVKVMGHGRGAHWRLVRLSDGD